MRISELAERSAVPVATIKYYLREGLLPSGVATSATLATYGEVHLMRLRLIRVLREVGQVPVAAVGAVLAAIDDPRLSLPNVFAVAHHALGPAPDPQPSAAHQEARAAVWALITGRHWRVDPDAPAVDALAAALVALQSVIGPCGAEMFTPYADAAEQLARVELESIDPGQGIEHAVGQIVVGTVIFEHALVALRRLAEEHFSGERFGRLDLADRPRKSIHDCLSPKL